MYWRHVGKHVLLSAAAKKYRSLIKAVLWEHRARGEFRPMRDARLRIVATYHPPTRRKWDLDNHWKQLADALEKGGAFDDDGQIDDLRLVRSGTCKGGRVVVEIEEIMEEAA